MDVPGRAKEVEVAIRAKDLGPALRWCEDNASRLRKLESKLEFRVRERAFLEMVRANQREEVETIMYCFFSTPTTAVSSDCGWLKKRIK